jgi:hypothetical protein
MTLLAQLAALLAIVSTGIVYGTDAFCALVLRSALARVDDVHPHRDHGQRAPLRRQANASSRNPRHHRRRAASVFAAVAGHPAESATAGAAFLLLLVWVLLYLLISAPINRNLTAAADAHETPANARTLQRDWDRIIVPELSCRA